ETGRRLYYNSQQFHLLLHETGQRLYIPAIDLNKLTSLAKLEDGGSNFPVSWSGMIDG
ncbi:hypothetical protein FRX31_024515, partial [Thalictrum thalictroides]